MSFYAYYICYLRARDQDAEILLCRAYALRHAAVDIALRSVPAFVDLLVYASYLAFGHFFLHRILV
jgi:hypothetical protein